MDEEKHPKREPTRKVPAAVRPGRRKIKPGQRWLPLAAAAAIAGLILYFSKPTELQRGDLNRDGVLDVVDALLLAEEIRRGQGRDVNRDRKIDAADAAEVALRAVRLEGSR